ncbi:ImmA/IrrE family metallo-endopeptidase, partial [Okeania sp. SIO2B9]|uniref:ImmA/IrrE family metallo-endopeptidase n=1 Tax=Okeania sp. SIO2B9 TaxID=2607782 RepID=UPI00142D0B68|nr:hypothetical protein [Okeania sp. SIO2B9]
EKRQGKDLTKWSNLYKIKDELGVSISNLTYRLQEFGWIYIPKESILASINSLQNIELAIQ